MGVSFQNFPGLHHNPGFLSRGCSIPLLVVFCISLIQKIGLQESAPGAEYMAMLLMTFSKSKCITV